MSQDNTSLSLQQYQKLVSFIRHFMLFVHPINPNCAYEIIAISCIRNPAYRSWTKSTVFLPDLCTCDLPRKWHIDLETRVSKTWYCSYTEFLWMLVWIITLLGSSNSNLAERPTKVISFAVHISRNSYLRHSIIITHYLRKYLWVVET